MLTATNTIFLPDDCCTNTNCPNNVPLKKESQKQVVIYKAQDMGISQPVPFTFTVRVSYMFLQVKEMLMMGCSITQYEQ